MRKFKYQQIIAWDLNAPPTKDRAHDANTAKALRKKPTAEQFDVFIIKQQREEIPLYTGV